MHCFCEREELLRVLTIGGRACPAVLQVTCIAHTIGDTSIEVLAWQETSGVGVWATVSADVREAGVLTVPTRTVADALAGMAGSRISLSSVQIPEPALVSTDLIKPLPAGPALQIESTSSTGNRQCTRVRLGSLRSEQTMELAFAEWCARGVLLASFGSRALREAWDPCLLLAKKRDEASDNTPTMDHALVLFRFDPQALVCTATTQCAVFQTRLSWTCLGQVPPVSHVLVDERHLSWISNALKGETQPVTLTLVPQADSTALLLVSFSQVTLVCRATTAPIPLLWEQRVHAPASQVALLSRVLFARSLDILSADSDRTISLQCADRCLCLQWNPQAQEENQTVICQLPIANTVQEHAAVLVHLRSLREMLRQFKGSAVCLEQGTIQRRTRTAAGEVVSIGFVRLSKPTERTIQMLMKTSEPEQVSPPGV